MISNFTLALSGADIGFNWLQEISSDRLLREKLLCIFTRITRYRFWSAAILIITRGHNSLPEIIQVEVIHRLSLYGRR